MNLSVFPIHAHFAFSSSGFASYAEGERLDTENHEQPKKLCVC
jgi:hypothetical protein